MRNMRAMTRRVRRGELPEAVTQLYGIDRATPVNPLFVFVVGSPGAGKSRAHNALFELGVFKRGDNYATINLDSLLESLVAFRAASALGHSFHTMLGNSYPAGAKSFSSIKSYKSKKSNAGAFNFFRDADSQKELFNALVSKYAAEKGITREEAATHLSSVFSKFNTLSDVFSPSSDVSESLIDLNDEAIDVAIHKHINIVWETTFSNIDKFDKYYKKLIDNGYMIVVLHVVDTAEHIIRKIKNRQEFITPYQEFPFYRYIPSKESIVKGLIEKNAHVVGLIQERLRSGVYDPDLVFVDEYVQKFDPSRLKSPVEFDFDKQINHILDAYGSNAYRSGGRRRTRRLRQRR